MAAEDLEAKLREVRRGLSDSSRIDPERLRGAVADDLLREKLLEWLEAHSTVTEREPAPSDDATPATPKEAKPAKAEKAAKEDKADKAAKAEKAGKGEKGAKATKPEADA